MVKYKSLNQAELESYCEWVFARIKNAQLQGVWATDTQLVLELYSGQSKWLVIDLSVQQPSLVLIQKAKPPLPKKTKPMGLFINAHGKDLRLLEMQVMSPFGRVVQMHFSGGERKLLLTAVLIPRMPNLLAESNEKKMSWNKPRNLPESTALQFQSEIENFESLEELWWQARQGKSQDGDQKPLAAARAIEKKKKAMQALKESIESGHDSGWRELGELLKYSSQIPDDLQKFYNSKQSLAWNRENCFKKAKSLIEKRKGSLERMAIVEAEIAKLEAGGDLVQPHKPGRAKQALQKHSIKARTLDLGNGISAVCGKSAKDNLDILRQARAWDYWLHLKDYPGAHALIFRERNQIVTQDKIEKVARWLISESRKIKLDGRLAVVVVESRHVRPIKGDRLGRVTYHNPQVYTFASSS